LTNSRVTCSSHFGQDYALQVEEIQGAPDLADKADDYGDHFIMR
jgi:hypothetical protein